MEQIIDVEIRTEYITLGQLIKYLGLIDKGSDVKEFLILNNIIVQNQKEIKRGKKIYKNMVVKINNQSYKII